MTKDGWKPLGGPMQPTPAIEPWWSFGLLGHGTHVEFDEPSDVADLFDHIVGDRITHDDTEFYRKLKTIREYRGSNL